MNKYFVSYTFEKNNKTCFGNVEASVGWALNNIESVRRMEKKIKKDLIRQAKRSERIGNVNLNNWKEVDKENENKPKIKPTATVEGKNTKSWFSSLFGVAPSIERPTKDD